MATLELIITDAGRQAIVNETNDATLPVRITQIALGEGDWGATPPDASATALHTELKRLDTVGGLAVAEDTMHVTITDDSPDAYTVTEFGLYTDSGILFAIYYDQAGITDKASEALLLLSADIVMTSVPPGSVVVEGPGFVNPQATEAVPGVAEIATQIETDAGTDDQRMVTPKKLAAYAQPKDATLSALAGTGTVSDTLIYADGPDSFTTTPITPFCRALLGDPDANSARSRLGAQTADATLTALAGTTTGPDTLVYANDVDSFSPTPLTAFARTLLDDVGAPDARSTLGLGTVALQAHTNVDLRGGLITNCTTADGVIDGCFIERTDIGTNVPASGNFSELTENGVRAALVKEHSFSATVGSGGDFPSIGAALAYFSRFNSSLGAKGTITLLSGFVMAEQVIVDGDDFSKITIKSQDSLVSIDPIPLAQYQDTDLLGPVHPAFWARAGGSLPHISTLFKFVAVASGTCGVWVDGPGSRAHVSNGCGFQNAFYGVYASRGGALDASGALIENSTQFNVVADQGATISASSVIARDSSINIYVNNGSTVIVDSATLTSAGEGVRAANGSRVVASNADFTACPKAINAKASSTVEASSILGFSYIYAYEGSIVNANGASAHQIFSFTGSTVNANASGAAYLWVSGGGQISAPGSSASRNIAANTVTPDGIIFV